MHKDVQLAGLKALLADLDASLKNLNGPMGLTVADVVFRKQHVEHSRKKVLLKIAIVQGEDDVGASERELSQEQSFFESVRKVAATNEASRQAERTKIGGNAGSPEVLDSVAGREEAVVQELKQKLARSTIGHLKLIELLDRLKEKLRGLERQDSEWSMLAKTIQGAGSASTNGRYPSQRPDAPPHSPLSGDATQEVERADASGKNGTVKFRSALRRHIALLLTTNPSATDLEIARALDGDGAVALPKGWQSNRNRSYEVAYKDQAIRNRLEQQISKVRLELRKARLL